MCQPCRVVVSDKCLSDFSAFITQISPPCMLQFFEFPNARSNCVDFVRVKFKYGATDAGYRSTQTSRFMFWFPALRADNQWIDFVMWILSTKIQVSVNTAPSFIKTLRCILCTFSPSDHNIYYLCNAVFPSQELD